MYKEVPDPMAMQIILLYEKEDLPHLNDACIAAGRGCLEVLKEYGLDNPAIKEWHNQPIRKIVRRAKPVEWAEVEGLPNTVVASYGEAIVLASLPQRMSEVPKEVLKLQMTNWTLPWNGSDSTPAEGFFMTINPSLKLEDHPGKAMVQVAHVMHVAYKQATKTERQIWEGRDFLSTLSWNEGDFSYLNIRPNVNITDAGYTVVAPGSNTVRATWHL